MSDVWQGPGWWLASDGKWYPADAEPGAVYDGDLSTDSNESATTEAVGRDSAVLDTPVTTTTITDTPQFDDAELVAETPDVDMSATAPPTAPDPVEARGLSFGSSPSESATGGGWQAITPDPEPGAPDLAALADEALQEDGWTSAYEERQVVSDILGVSETPPEIPPVDSIGGVGTGFAANNAVLPDTSMPAPDVFMPAADVSMSPAPDTAIPDLTAPDTAIPDLTAPDTAIPDLTAPDTAIPDLAAPDTAIPDLTFPTTDFTAPTAPVAGIPDLTTAATPDVAMPTTPEIPDLTIPTTDVTAPTAPVADVPTANFAANDLTVPRTLDPDTLDPGARGAAWRTPNETQPLTRPEPQQRTEAPTVVDLAVPQEGPSTTEEPRKRGLGPLLAGVIGLAVLVGAAILISSVLSGGGDDQSAVDAATPAETATPAVDEAESVVDDGTTSVFELRAGDCIVGDIGSGQVTEVTKVDCEVEHNFEVYREVLIDSSITTFDEGAISAYAEDVCRTSLEAYVPATDPRGLSFKFLQPTEESWNQADEPDRVVTCLLFDDDAPLVGRASAQ